MEIKEARMTEFIIVGAGIFGVTTAIELRERGYTVSLVDPGPLPHPLAASTDISKVIRMEYGADEQYMKTIAVYFCPQRIKKAVQRMFRCRIG